jgi:P4 family phage/plasmid primase-like protien
MADGAVEAGVMAFLQSMPAKAIGGAATRNCASNVLANLRSLSLCYLPAHLEAPCWISSGESAKGWLPMASLAVNIPAAAGFLVDMHGEEMVQDDWDSFSRPNTPDLFATYGVTFDLEPYAHSPAWHAYLDRVQPDAAAQRVISQMMGLSMVPDTKYNCAFFLFGQPGTGKSVFLHVLRALVGHANCCAVPLARMGEKHSTWPLTESLLNIVGDLETDDGHGSLRALEGTFKDVCDGSYIPVERKHKDVSSARVTARCVFATNSLPTFTDRTETMWDRLRILPFNVRIRGSGEEDPDLRDKLADVQSLQGIFLWALMGLGELRKARRFPEHPEGIAAKAKHKFRCDLEGAYLDDHYERTEGGGGHVDSSTAYKKFYEWLRENGFGIRTKNTFNDAVSRVFGIEETRQRMDDGTNPRVFRGLRQKHQQLSSVEI